MCCQIQWIIVLMGISAGCIAKHAPIRNEFDSPGEFGLGLTKQSSPALIDDITFNENNEGGLDRSLVQSSLPLPIKVGKAGSRFGAIPNEAVTPTAASYKILWGKNCQLNLVTDTVQVDRYLNLANGALIKMKEGLAAHQTVVIDRGAPFHFRLSTKVKIAPLTAASGSTCRSALFGKKTPLGLFHIAATSVTLAPSPGSPPAQPTALAGDNNAEALFIKWDIKASAPMLVDNFDSPVFLESPLYQLDGSRDGFYYLVVHPSLKQAKGKSPVGFRQPINAARAH